MSTDVDLTGKHPCAVPGCHLSAEEHHRVNVGLVMENAELRKRGGAVERPNLADFLSEEIPGLSGLINALRSDRVTTVDGSPTGGSPAPSEHSCEASS